MMHFTSLVLMASTAAAAAWPKPTGGYGYGRPCSQEVVALAAGIHLNIQGQWAEYNGTLLVEQVETAQAGNTTAFLLAKGKLESDVQAGMNIRLTNQLLTPPGNPVIPGLAEYAAAEETEKALAAGLTGDYSVDKTAIDSLKSDILTGIKLNTANLANATSVCDFTLVFPPADIEGS